MPDPTRRYSVRFQLVIPGWVIAELERYAQEHPEHSIDAVLSDSLRKWAEVRRATRLRESLPRLGP